MLSIDFSTITNNSSSAGGAIQLGAGEILKGADCASVAGSLVGSGLNLDTDGSCAALAGATFDTVPFLGLGVLADNGGRNRSHLPMAGGPAVDGALSCSGPFGNRILTDQRGYPRPTDDDGDAAPECEVGAIERGPVFLDGFEVGSTINWSD
jgi:hypothetical protein